MFPEDKLTRIRELAMQNGVGGSISDAVRWAAMQGLISLEAACQKSELSTATS
jgi:hypothetical protein